VPWIHHPIGDYSNIFMEKPMVFFLPHFAGNPSGPVRKINFPPSPSSMKIVSMEKKKDRIFRSCIIIKIFRKDDEEALFFLEAG
jgi:hypothetical protein